MPAGGIFGVNNTYGFIHVNLYAKICASCRCILEIKSARSLIFAFAYYPLPIGGALANDLLVQSHIILLTFVFIIAGMGGMGGKTSPP